MVATRRIAAGSRIKRINPSIESLTLGGVTLAACHICNTVVSSSSHARLISTSIGIRVSTIKPHSCSLDPDNHRFDAGQLFDICLSEAHFAHPATTVGSGVVETALGFDQH